jgi:hypothetical protein
MLGYSKVMEKIWKRHKPVKVEKKKRFQDIAGKNDSHAHMQEKKPRPPRPTNQIERTDI